MGKLKINRQQLFFEFLSVVFAVLLALLLNSWREAVMQRETIRQVKEKIQQEVVQNNSAVNQALKYHTTLLEELRSNNHLVRKVPLADFPVDPNDDRALAQFVSDRIWLETNQLLEVQVESRLGRRILIIGDQPFRLEIKDEELLMFGNDNIQLRSAGLQTSAWQIAQATGVLVDMELELVSGLAQLNELQQQYKATSDKALEMLYTGQMAGFVPVLEDIFYYEQQMLDVQESVLSNL